MGFLRPLEVGGLAYIRHRIALRCGGATLRIDELVELIPGVCAGQPVVKGTRLPVKFIYEMLDEGWTPEEIVKFHYPFLSLEVVEGPGRAQEGRGGPHKEMGGGVEEEG